MTKELTVERLLASRRSLPMIKVDPAARNEAAEGGCGVIGIACSEAIPGRHLLQSLIQMRNRGNGKGGGIAAVGLVAEEFGVSRRVMEEDYLIAVAYLDPSVRDEVEQTSIKPAFEIDHIHEQGHIDNFTTLEGLDVPPPEVVYYFVRVKPEAVKAFRGEFDMIDAPQRKVEDEIVFQNTYKLNSQFYASTGETRAFVLSHGKNLLVLKMVGYGDDVIKYYQLEDLHAHVWIGHHRYPTKGRVWHPGGAHPFVGLNEALVHNGDFANYASISEYLAQRNIYPLFLTDTEVSVQVFDLLHRIYDYPLEYVIEALAPTTERDFTRLPEEKQRLYKLLQTTHMHSSPDGPWFFLIAQSAPEEVRSETYRLIGITDTSMLRPQVFALQNGGKDGPSIGFAASEKQGIDAALESLAAEDPRFCPHADRYWNARGGSHTDGGAFIFSITPNGNGGSARLVCTDKFGREVGVDSANPPYQDTETSGTKGQAISLPEFDTSELSDWIKQQIPGWEYASFKAALGALAGDANSDVGRRRAIQILTDLIDQRYPTGVMRRSSLVSLCDQALNQVFESLKASPSELYAFISQDQPIPEPVRADQIAVINARGYKPEGKNSLAMLLVELHNRGFSNFIVANARGHRFIGNGFGANSTGIRIDVYGSSGDYLASGLDGMQIHVHGNAQDQLCQIMKSGKLVVHGDVGQTFGYAAKGGQVYILGNAAGRPMINAVGRPRVVINGTCLDYLAESFMAGDPHNEGGFVILNGIHVTDQGEIVDLEEPYPGGNLFSLASGGCIFIRDPQGKVSEDQLNGGEFAPMEARDWELITPYLEENERHFGISIDALLQGEQPGAVYRKIQPQAVRALQAEETWVRH
jgi:glutamate synthase domain-containing protein 1/glutamate synthase domain-containing protein 3